MLRLQAFKFELRPNGDQVRTMRCFAGSCRFVFNQALALQQERHAAGEKPLNYSALCSALIEWRHSPETLGLSETPSPSLQQSLKGLDQTYVHFFAGRSKFPRFKKKGRSGHRFRYPREFNLDPANNPIFLPKLGWVRYRNSREVLGTAKSVTVSQSGGKWFVSLQTEPEVAVPLHAGGAIGIDLGVVRFATLSDGTVFEPLNSFKHHEKTLRKAQRCLSIKKKFIGNWRKAMAKVQRIPIRIANARRDYLYKASTAISQNHAMVCMEDLQVDNMSASAAGTAGAPGNQVRAKSGLNKAIRDRGSCDFRRQLEYKTAWNGGHRIAVPPQNTSRTCPGCGHVAQENRPTQAHFLCVECGFAENADLAGALNGLRAGHARLACGDTSPVRASAQEATEATTQRFAVA